MPGRITTAPGFTPHPRFEFDCFSHTHRMEQYTTVGYDSLCHGWQARDS